MIKNKFIILSGYKNVIPCSAVVFAYAAQYSMTLHPA